MRVVKIVFYIERRMPTLKLVQTVTVQDGKVILKVNKVLILPPRKERRKLQRSYGGSP